MTGPEGSDAENINQFHLRSALSIEQTEFTDELFVFKVEVWGFFFSYLKCPVKLQIFVNFVNCGSI